MGRASGPVTRAVTRAAALRGHEPAAGTERAGGGRGERAGQARSGMLPGRSPPARGFPGGARHVALRRGRRKLSGVCWRVRV